MLSIVILAYERLLPLKRCLQSIWKHTQVPFEIILCDNGSTLPGLRSYVASVEATSSNVKLIQPGINLGCGGGRNLAGRLANGDFIVFLDDDMVVTPGWDTALIRTARGTQAGAVAALILEEDARTVYSNGGYDRQLAPRGILLREIDQGKVLEDYQPQSHICSWAPGGALLVRRECYQRVQYPARLILGYNDAYFSWSIRQAGYQIATCPESRVIHNRQGAERITSCLDTIHSRRHIYLVSALEFLEQFGVHFIATEFWGRCVFGIPEEAFSHTLIDSIIDSIPARLREGHHWRDYDPNRLAAAQRFLAELDSVGLESEEAAQRLG